MTTTHDGVTLNAENLKELFEELNTELVKRGQSAQLFIVGGAAMALAYDATRSTRDVDAVFYPPLTVRELSETIAQHHGLEPDWINDAAKGFMPGDDSEARTVFETDSLLVQVASPEYLLAMKLHSSRDSRDFDDAVTLFKLMGYTTTDEAITLLERRYPASQLLPRHSHIAEEVARQARSDTGSR
ncbi:MAG: nucleotidyl transferase [Propionibacteriaceae bacterium]|jgi:hypothetical protein|nr:nucleotidyl transferase [Propionibacteriaceae bacterium]